MKVKCPKVHTVTLLFTASVTDLEDNLQMQMKVTYAENSVNVPQVATVYPSLAGPSMEVSYLLITLYLFLSIFL